MSQTDVTVILRLIDGITGPAKKAAASLRGIVTAANALKKLNLGSNLTSGLKASQVQMRAMLGDTKQLSSALRGSTVSARGLTSAMSAGKSAYAADVRNLKQMVALQGQMARGQQRMAGGGGGSGRHGMGMGGMYGAIYAAHEVKQLMEPGAHEGMEVLHQQALFTTLGMDAKEQAEAFAASVQASHDIVTSSVSDNQQMIRELRQAFLHPHDAITHLGAFVKGNAIFKAIADSHGGMGGMQFKDQAYDFAKAIEQMNITKPAMFEEYLDSMVRAVGAFGGKLTGRDFHQSIKQMRQGGQNLSKEFVGQVLPTLIQEYKVGNSSGGGGGGSGGSVGTALMSLFEVVTMGKMTKGAATQWIKLGLAKNSDRTKSGLHPGAIDGSDLYMQDPYQFAWQKLVPAMLKKGIITPENIEKIKKGEVNNEKFARDITQFIAGLGGTRTARDVLTRMVLQQARIERDRINILQSLGFASWDELKSLDPKVMMNALKEQSASLMGTLWKPFIKGMMPALASVGKRLADASMFLWKNPELAKTIDLGIGAIGLGLLRLALKRVGLGTLLGGGVGLLFGGVPGAALGGVLGGRGFGAGAGAAGAVAGATFASRFIAVALKGLSKGLGVYAILQAIMGVKKDDKDPEHKTRSGWRKSLGIDDSGIKYREWDGKKFGPLQSMPDPSRSQEWLPSPMEGIRRLNPFGTSPGGLNRDPVPFANLVPKIDMDQSGWGKTFTGQVGASTGFAPEADQSKADSEGKSWGQSFLDAVKAIVSGAAIAGPNVAAPSVAPGSIGVPMRYAPAAPAGGGGAQRASLGSVVVHVGGIVVHGNGDPRAVADEVHRKFTSAVSRHLSDGAFA